MSVVEVDRARLERWAFDLDETVLDVMDRGPVDEVAADIRLALDGGGTLVVQDRHPEMEREE
jgi:hypothetical protein